MKFAFLILHYMNADVTMSCIESLLVSMPDMNYSIVVVDNASNNGSYEVIKEKYKNNENIHLLHNEKNLGYARGNNTGFSYAKHKLNAEWICLANNDVIFSDSMWIDKVTDVYKEKPYYVLGPDIVTPDGKHQNPFRDSVPGKKEVIKNLIHDEIVYVLLKLGIQRRLRSKLNIKDVWDDVNWKDSQENCNGVLHGSCFVFSPDYVNEFEGLYNGTFLYTEEEILCYILKKVGCRYVYYNGVQVTHCHSTSFKKSIQDEDRRKMVMVRHRIKSYRKFLKIVFTKKNVEKFLKG